MLQNKPSIQKSNENKPVVFILVVKMTKWYFGSERNRVPRGLAWWLCVWQKEGVGLVGSSMTPTVTIEAAFLP